jgi:2-C-methyl-D-erythritol 2,4-cyclodiphosphate synthase
VHLLSGHSSPTSGERRVGIGYDAHRFREGRRLLLGGVEIPASRGLEGHSDADVLAHAITDALLGAAGQGDIGGRFPDSDPIYRNADSVSLLAEVTELLEEEGWRIVNVDATILCESPHLQPFVAQMVQRLAAALKVAKGSVNVKATTNEGMGYIGRGEGAAALAVAQIDRGLSSR